MNTWMVVLAALIVVGVAIAVVGYARIRWLMLEEQRAYAAEPSRTVTVTITADATAFVAAMRAASQAAARMRPAFTQMGGAARQVAEVIGRSYEDMLYAQRLARIGYIGRLCMIVQVRAGLDPAYRDPAALHVLVARILSPRFSSPFAFLTDAERLEVAAAALRGWAESYHQLEPRTPLAIGRRYGNTSVTVVAP